MATAFILINTEIGTEGEVVEALSSISEVKEAYVVYGVYDVLVKVEADNMDVLRDIVSSKIRKLPKVRSTMTMIVVEERKFSR